jgi:uncharacterized cupredoxin-like copper-binding protein
MSRLLPIFSIAAAAFAAQALNAQSPDWAHAPKVQVTLSNFAFSPSALHLHAGRPVVLHLVNTSSGGHDFSAPSFFEAAQLRDAAAVDEGSVELRGHQSVDIALVPKAGHYSLKCGHAFHKMFGMSGQIVVD